MTAKVPENPYEAARGVWNERYRRFVTEKRNWQILAALALVANATQAGGMAWLASQSRVVPYIVRVDEAGRSLVIGPAAEAAHADARVIAWQLQDYLQRARQEQLLRGWLEALGPGPTIVDVLSTLLAVLELAKRGVVRLAQPTPFSPMVIARDAARPVA